MVVSLSGANQYAGSTVVVGADERRPGRQFARDCRLKQAYLDSPGRRQGAVVGCTGDADEGWSTAVVSPAFLWASIALATMESRARGAHRLHGF